MRMLKLIMGIEDWEDQERRNKSMGRGDTYITEQITSSSRDDLAQHDL